MAKIELRIIVDTSEVPADEIIEEVENQGAGSFLVNGREFFIAQVLEIEERDPNCLN